MMSMQVLTTKFEILRSDTVTLFFPYAHFPNTSVSRAAVQEEADRQLMSVKIRQTGIVSSSDRRTEAKPRYHRSYEQFSPNLFDLRRLKDVRVPALGHYTHTTYCENVLT